MVLARFGCHRAPFGSFPRVGKNSPAHQPMCKGTMHQQAQLIAHHLAYNEGSPPVLPGRQRTTDITPQAAPARKRIASRSMRLLPQTKRRGVRGQPWCCLGLAATGRPLVLSREWERTAPHIRRCAKEPYSSHQQKRPPARATGKDPRSARRSHAQQSPKTTPGQLPRHAGKLACLHRQCLTPSAAAADPPASPCPSRTEESAAPASGDGFPPPAPR